MKKYLIVLFFLCLFSIRIKSQTYSFNTSCFYNQTQCDVFSNNNMCGSLPLGHFKTTHGSPKLIDLTGIKKIALEIDINTNKKEGFYVPYNFKKNYIYTVFSTIYHGDSKYTTPVTVNGCTQIPCNNAFLKVYLTNGLVENNPGCVLSTEPSNASKVAVNSTPIHASGISLNQQFTSQNNFSQLWFTSTSYGTCGSPCFANDGLGSIAIGDITITENDKLHFTFPGSVSLTCGSLEAKQFTVSNPSGITGTLTYRWTIGAGWTYNGTPVTTPLTITTSTSSISLTPTATPTLNPLVKPGNVAVTPIVDGIDWESFTCTTNVVQGAFPTPLPQISSNGNNTICATNGTISYTLNNVPAGATIFWDATPNGAVSFPLGQTTNPVTVQRSGNANAAVSLTALVTLSSCNNSYTTPARIINVGLPFSLYPAIANPPEAVKETGIDEGPCNSQCYSPSGPTIWWNVPIANNSTGETWQKVWSFPANYSFWSPGTNKIGLFFKGANQSVEFRRTLTNACGNTQEYYCFTSTTSLCTGLRTQPVTTTELKVYPNPISTNKLLSIEIIADDESIKTTFENCIIQLLDGKENVIVQKKGEKVEVESLEIPALTNGIYYVRVVNKNGFQTKQIIIKN